MGGIYLTKIDYKSLPFCSKDNFSGNSEKTESLDDCVDPQEANEGSEESIVKFEYHIVYNTSYSVPVLYFNSTKPGIYDLMTYN